MYYFINFKGPVQKQHAKNRFFSEVPPNYKNVEKTTLLGSPS